MLLFEEKNLILFNIIKYDIKKDYSHFSLLLSSSNELSSYFEGNSFLVLIKEISFNLLLLFKF